MVKIIILFEIILINIKATEILYNQQFYVNVD